MTFEAKTVRQTRDGFETASLNSRHVVIEWKDFILYQTQLLPPSVFQVGNQLCSSLTNIEVYLFLLLSLLLLLCSEEEGGGEREKNTH